MKRLSVLVLGVVLSGCVGGGKQLVRHELPSEVDEAKVASVNQWATARGAIVTWVNMPTKVRETAKEKGRD